MRRFVLPLIAVGLIAVSLSGCVVYPGGGGGGGRWCYYHPYRC